ncbi:MAG: NAD(P)H-binding protein [Pseudomonadota bacterium]
MTGLYPPTNPARPRVFLAGASGTIGQAVAKALVEAGHEVVCFLRPSAESAGLPAAAQIRRGHVDDPASLVSEGFRGERFDAVISCMASRTGVAEDAWQVDYRANLALLGVARAVGVERFVLLSAICVQKPRLAFQRAKLAFEEALQASGLDWTIVRPTAFFKSLSGQVARVMAGKPYLVVGDGRRTACKPISDRDLARFLVATLADPSARDAVLPIGGPGPAITPRDQAEALFGLLGRPLRLHRVPLGVLDGVGLGLGVASVLAPSLRAKAELARIGRYYASESMLVLDPATGRYDADATPSYGSDTLVEHYAALIRSGGVSERGAHTVFGHGKATPQTDRKAF